MDAAALARAFGLRGRAVLSDGPVARGKEGAVWRLDTADGPWAVTVLLRRTTEDDVRASTAFQEAARSAGVPAPAVHRSTSGDVLVDVDGAQVRLYEWVDLDPPDPGLDPALVGAAVAAAHRVRMAGEDPPDPWSHEPVGAARWDSLVRRLAEAGAPFARRLAELRDELVALEGWMEPPEDLQMCHRDLWADNVLPTRDGGVCLVDWENSGSADPSRELACVLFEFARDDHGRARALVDAYESSGGPGRVDRPAHFSMLVAQLGHITELAGRDWLEPNRRSPERADAAAWISETLDDPHTRERLTGLLDCVRQP